MRIGIFSPYLDTLGGGERYIITIAQCLAKNHQVDLIWNDQLIKTKIEKQLDLSLDRVNFVKNTFFLRKNLLKRWGNTRNYQVFFYLSDGSIPFLFAKKNIIHFQVPFTKINGRSFINQLKIRFNNRIICNSQFTKKFIDKEFGVRSQVVYPPVTIGKLMPGKKQNLILSVSRFSKTLHAKKQEVLVKVFSDLVKDGLKNWKLILAGALKKDDESHFKQLKTQAKGQPIEFLANASFKQLQELYGKSKIFWHAVGFGEDEKTHPERMEHFGIVVVEAMAAGCVPIAVGRGGIPEIINNGRDGFLWQTEEELKKLTVRLIKSPEEMIKISKMAIKNCHRFDEDKFCEKINELVEA